VISLRRAVERHRLRRPEPDAWLSFHPPEREDPLASQFGDLMSVKETWLPPGAPALRVLQPDGELLTYVREGSFSHEDSHGESSVIHAGEFHLRAVGGGAEHLEFNPSPVDSAHIYQICMRRPGAEAATWPAQQQRFSVAQRRGQLCLIASPDASQGSLRLDQDARLYSALLEPGQHLVHEMAANHCAWLHLVHGAASVGDVMLSTGDGAGISDRAGVSVTAREESEILLVDVRRPLAIKTSG
jgi:quercetin 2,3-dioxygenase